MKRILYKAQYQNKVYIGHTFNTLEDRIDRHKYLYTFNIKSELYSALREYGFDNFKWDIISSHDTQESLDKAEKSLIKDYRSREDIECLNVGDGDIE